MFPHHERAIQRLKQAYEAESDCLAVVVGGSVAKGWAKENSDVDFLVVVSGARYKQVEEAGRLTVNRKDITDYEGTGIITTGMDHIGFKVENVERFKEDVDRIAADNPLLAPSPLGTGAEGKALLKLFRRSCPLGQHQMADCDGVLIDVAAD